MDTLEQFYNQLAQDYHANSADWEKSIIRQGEILSRLITRFCDEKPLTLLDCTCGIGTQAIGLAKHPQFTVHATDLSPEAVTRAKAEAETFGVQINFDVANVLNLENEVEGVFDIVLSCDNAIAHFLTDNDLYTAFRNMKSKTAPRGLLLISLRDYDQLLLQKPRSTRLQISDSEDGRYISFQVWDWLGDGRRYHLNHFMVKAREGRWETLCNITQMRAWRRTEITLALKQTGFHEIAWHSPEETGYFQPIVTARSDEVPGRV